MKRIVRITPHFAVTGALAAGRLRGGCRAGLPVHRLEPAGRRVAGLPRSGRDGASWPRDAGLGFRHIPVTKAEAFSERVVGGTRDGARRARRSGARALRLRPALGDRLGRGRVARPARRCACCRSSPPPASTSKALRDELEDLHDPGNASPIPRRSTSARRYRTCAPTSDGGSPCAGAAEAPPRTMDWPRARHCCARTGAAGRSAVADPSHRAALASA